MSYADDQAGIKASATFKKKTEAGDGLVFC